MKLQFDAQQQYQLDAVEAVCDLFDGQQTTSSAGLFGVSGLGMFQNEQGMGNLLQLDEETLLQNLRAVQTRNKLPLQEEFGGHNFTIEMETGTGKTYVYLRTIFELHQRYGFSKFIIVVPGKAIREGVLKSLEITREHLRALYGNPAYNFFAYSSKRPADLRAFATSNNLSVMLINVEAFDTQDNVINRASDTIGGIPIELVQKTKPIVIIDEPQNMETPIRKAALASLHPLCTLRYSATHKDIYNQVYRLTPVDAYDQGLVKRIEVASVAEEGSQNDAYIKLKSIKAGKTSIGVTLEIESVEKGKGVVKKKSITCSSKAGTSCDLFVLSGGMPAYEPFKGHDLGRIDPEAGEVEFSNGKVVSTNETQGEMRGEVMRQQIAETIKEHLDKMVKFKERGVRIKVLSLFFIDTVANYRNHEAQQKGKLAVWFEELYEEYRVLPKYKVLSLPDVAKVHDGYFSKDKAGGFKDTKGTTEDDRSTYELIMKDKERLLSPEEPLQFIFSHSTLREGWDNPNVFQICTLNESESYVKKRQEIGRGLRLPVDYDGARVFDRSINVLTVVANESYEVFAKTLQNEIEDETGQVFGSDRIVDKRKRKSVSLKKKWELDANFIAIWDRIKQKTRYAVSLDVQKFITASSEAVAGIASQAPRIRVDVASLSFDVEKGILTTTKAVRTGKRFEQSLPVPDILTYIANHTELTRQTILAILEKAQVYDKIRTNPQYMMDAIVGEVRRIMQTMIMDGIKYEEIAGQEYEMQIFKDAEIESYISTMYKVEVPEKTIFDYVVHDSDIELNFAKELEAREEILFYMKLPSAFKIETPLGTYNPDWAIIFKRDTKLYLVAETKGTNRMDEISLSEQLKIKAGGKHFAAIGEAIYIAPVKDMQGLVDRIE
jgi:type III restriction enzyme